MLASALRRTATRVNTYHFGSLGRNVIIGPGFTNTDFSVIKNTRLSENVRVQFRAEIFNLLNHDNFGFPDGNISNATVGTITTADDGRNAQFGLRFAW